MNEKIVDFFRALIALIIFGVAIYFIFKWFSYKLLIVIFLFEWANNISNIVTLQNVVKKKVIDQLYSDADYGKDKENSN